MADDHENTYELSASGNRYSADPADGGDLPHDAGDRKYRLGRAVTLSDNGLSLSPGEFVTFDGSGGVSKVSDLSATAPDAVVMNTAPGPDGKDNDLVAVHTTGIVRALPADAHDGTADTVTYAAGNVEGVKAVDTFDNGDVLVSF